MKADLLDDLRAREPKPRVNKLNRVASV